MGLKYYEDVKVGDMYRSREYLLTEENIIDYARQWDPRPVHVCPEKGKATPFGGLIASGFHLLSICTKLAAESPDQGAIIAGLGMRDIHFHVPGRPGDVLVIEHEITAKRNSKGTSDAGLVYSITRLLNQKGEKVLSMKGTGLIKKRRRT